MKRYNRWFEYTQEFVENCIFKCLANGSKWTRKDVSYFFAEYAIKFNKTDLDLHKAAIYYRKIAKEDKTKLFELIHLISIDLFDELNEKRIELKPIVYQERVDESSGKLREIGLASIKQQVYDYVAVESCKNMFLAKIGPYQCASLPGKGQVYGKKALEKWLKNKPNTTKYAFKCDIKKYYPSIKHDILKSKLKRNIKNEDINYLLGVLIDSYGEQGLCIGSYLSQYLANYYLSYACHYASEVLHHDIKHILFYMDDIILFSHDKEYLKRGINIFYDYIYDELGLEIKDKNSLFLVDNYLIDMMGYRISRDKTIIRKRIFLKARKLFIKYKDPNKLMSLNTTRKIVSYYGYFKNSNSNYFQKKYKVQRTLKRAKGVISNASKIHGSTT